jgi:glycine/D-amino acid oxidase-like deaminating enzyme
MSRTRYGVSPWAEALPGARRPAYPRLTESLEVPVVIVGGGLTGTATAYAVAAAGIRAALVEADRIGSGATASAPGVVLAEPDRYAELEQASGRRVARSIAQAVRRSALDLQATIRRLGLRCGLEAMDRLVYAESPEQARALTRDVRARKEAGLEAANVSGTILAALGVHASAGVRTHGHARLHPVRACQGLAHAAATRGTSLFERSAATRIRPTRHGVEVMAGRGMITASWVIVATGEPIPAFAALDRHFLALDRYSVMTLPLPAAVRNAIRDHNVILQDSPVPPHQLFWTGDGRIVWSGADQVRTPARTREKTLVQKTGQLMYELSLAVEAISGLPAERGWDAPYSRTSDGVPFIGPHRNYPHHLFAFGLGTNLAHAFLASRILLRHVTGQTARDDEAFGFTRLGR